MNLRSPLRYIGGKYHMSEKIINMFPVNYRDMIYVEPFGGAAHVLVEKRTSKLEIYNDINQNLVNLFKVFQNKEKTDKLIELMTFTPHSRQFFYDVRDDVYVPPIDDEMVKKAYKMLYMMVASFSGHSVGKGVNPSWSFNRKDSKSSGMDRLNNLPPKILYLVDRFKKIQIENLDFKQCIKDYDSENTLFYNDPPYWDCEFYYDGSFSKQDHEDLANILNNIKGKVILSYYYFESLDKWYPKDKWNYYEIETYKFCEKNIGTHKQKSIELLITNYEQEGKLF